MRELPRVAVEGDRPSAHGAKNDANGSMCQACHGDASEHLKDPIKAKPTNPFGKGHTADERTAVCMTCHSGNRNLAFWTSGKHQLNEVTCANCHSIHGQSCSRATTAESAGQIADDQQVHDDVPAEPGGDLLAVPPADPRGELQAVAPSDHRRQGQVLRLPQPARRDHAAMLKQPTINDQCYSCHADKRGPFIHNHPPVEENCATCHNPHGSVHARLLNESAPNLCQDCHDASRHPGTLYGSAGAFNCQPGDNSASSGVPNCPPNRVGQPNPGVNNRLVARACVNCHNAVHGSNAPANRGKFFLR
jgi:predicted CXXCH cytochrome family protein